MNRVATAGGKTTYKLTYFDGRGRAEVSRLLFVAAGVQFEDVRIQFEDWPTLKDKMPQGTLPVLEDDGLVICQSMAIARHLARKFGFHGNDTMTQAKVDIYLETVADLRVAQVVAFVNGTEEQKATARVDFEEKHLPTFLRRMEKVASENASGYIVGDKLTVVDLAVYDILEDVITRNPGTLDQLPGLKANRKMVAEAKLIKEYLPKRPRTSF